jgi:hypothetical protein
MGLPARQRRVLGRIEGALRGSDPRLAALYSIFARLTREEEMPRIEQLRHRVLVLLSSARRRLTIRRRRHRFGWLVPRQRAALLFPLALVLAVGSIVLAVKFGGGPACAPVTPLAATAKHPPQQPQQQGKLCRNEPAMGFYAGR